jgi:L-cysteine S-thiosulfotransferase
MRTMRLCFAVSLFFLTSHSSQSQSPDTRKSGYEFMSSATQALQNDDTQNPAMLWVKQGEALWNKAEGSAQKSCVSCHGNAATSMRGAASRHPSYDEKRALPLTLAQRVNACRTDKQLASPLRNESQDLLSLEVFVAYQSRGLAINPPNDKRLNPFIERGQTIYQQPLGQLNLSCAQCHDQQAGQRLGSAPIPQAHPTAYPIYRSEWQGLGSLQRRFRNCMSGVRAEPFGLGSMELTEIELFLMARAKGMKIETPGVRP